MAQLVGGAVDLTQRTTSKRSSSCKNLGDDDKQTEDDETSIDLKEYTCAEKIWRQGDDDADSSRLQCRQTGDTNFLVTHRFSSNASWLHPEASTRGPKSRFRVVFRNMSFQLI